MGGHTFELTGQEYILEVSGLEWNGMGTALPELYVYRLKQEIYHS